MMVQHFFLRLKAEAVVVVTLPLAQGKKRARAEISTTIQQRYHQDQDVADKAISSWISRLIKRWHCYSKFCKNWYHTCFELPDKRYLKLDSYALILWCEQINAGLTIVDKILPSLYHSLTQQEMKKKTTTSLNSSATVTNANGGRLPFEIHVYNYTGSSGRDIIEALRSSPPASDGYDLDNLGMYLKWCAQTGCIEEGVA